MVRESQRGFTLIEVTLVLAISSALLIMVLTGFSSTRAKSQFSQAVDTAREQMMQLRTASDASINTTGAGNGTGSNCVVTLGQLATFTPGSSTVPLRLIRTRNIERSACAAGSNPALDIASVPSPDALNLKWQLKYTGYTDATGFHAAKYQVAFTRSLADASLRAAASASWGTGPTNYSDVAPGTDKVSLNFISPDGAKALITIDLTNGGITRTFL